jgi:hypothetical protein
MGIRKSVLDPENWTSEFTRPHILGIASDELPDMGVQIQKNNFLDLAPEFLGM